MGGRVATSLVELEKVWVSPSECIPKLAPFFIRLCLNIVTSTTQQYHTHNP